MLINFKPLSTKCPLYAPFNQQYGAHIHTYIHTYIHTHTHTHTCTHTYTHMQTYTSSTKARAIRNDEKKKESESRKARRKSELSRLAALASSVNNNKNGHGTFKTKPNTPDQRRVYILGLQYFACLLISYLSAHNRHMLSFRLSS